MHQLDRLGNILIFKTLLSLLAHLVIVILILTSKKIIKVHIKRRRCKKKIKPQLLGLFLIAVGCFIRSSGY
jgi:hypothetical protein